MSENTVIQQVVTLIEKNENLVILTGAGVSKESGVPTFRDAMDGLWAKYDPEQLATPQAFKQNPKLVWDWYQFRRGLVRQAKPNPGHFALAEIERRFPKTQLITQNVDDLHERAGTKNIIHLHGNIAKSKCFNNCQGAPTLIDISQIEWNQESGPPPCPHCGAWVRPDVVWFHELLPDDNLGAAIDAVNCCDLMLVIGTSGFVTPAATMPSYAKSAGAKVVEVNPDYTMITRIVDLKLTGPSGKILPMIVEALAK